MVHIREKIAIVQKRGHAAAYAINIRSILWIGTFIEFDANDLRPYARFGQMIDDSVLGALDIKLQQVDCVMLQPVHDGFESVALRLEPVFRALQIQYRMRHVRVIARREELHFGIQSPDPEIMKMKVLDLG